MSETTTASKTNARKTNRLSAEEKKVKAAHESERVALAAKNEKVRKKVQYAAYGIALACLGVSIPHLCHGLNDITGCGWVFAVLMALVFDGAQVMAEEALVNADTYGLDKGLKRVSMGIILGCTIVSMLLNVRAFVEGKEGFAFFLGIILGVALPAIVLASMFIANKYSKAKAV